MIILNMIVKDEATVIERCLNSLLGFIYAIVICDTGSTDNTIEIIEKWKEKNSVPGVILRHEWKNFEHNRNLALDSCKEWIFSNEIVDSNICIIDADDYLVIEDKEVFYKSLEDDADRYLINMNFGNTVYGKTFMVKSDIQSSWRGVLHEYLDCPDSGYNKIEGCHIYVNRDGARSRDPLKYLKDAVTLEQALEEDPNNSRYLFYLAQSYRDFGYTNMAEKLYLERFDIPENFEERYIALLEAGKCRLYRGKNNEKTLNLFMKAFCFHPERLEAAYYIVQYFRMKELYAMGYHFGKNLISNNTTSDNLFIDMSIYKWRFLDEMGICACWSGDKQLFKTLTEQILEKELPENERKRIENNLAEYGK